MIYIIISLIIIIIGLFIAGSFYISRVLYNVGLNPDWDSEKDVADRAKVIKVDDKLITLEIFSSQISH